MRTLAPALLLFATTQAVAQTGVEPSTPCWGDSILITYEPGASGTLFAPEDDIYAVVHVFLIDDLWQKTLHLEREGDLLCAEFEVPVQTSSLRVDFVTRSAWDERHSLEVYVDRVAGEPAPGTRMRRAYTEQLRAADLFAEEMAAYPDNGAAWRDRWFLASGVEPQSLRSLVEAELPQLESSAGADRPGSMWSRVYAAMVLGEEPQARAFLLRMLEEDPGGYFTERALSDYQYQVFAQQLSGPGQEAVAAARRRAAQIAPESRVARESAHNLARREDFPLEATVRIATPWMAAEPNDPMPRLALARALLLHGGDLQRAAEAAAEACEIFHQGRYRLDQDFGGVRSRLLMPGAFALCAEIELARDQPTRALATLLLARHTLEQIDAKTEELTARTYRALGDAKSEAAAWLRAEQQGSKTARAELEVLWKRESSELPFAEWTHSLSTGTEVGENRAPMAAPFRARDMEGNTWDLDQLRGKVVVLNFWGLGCVPCKVEIPSLNQLVKEFAGEEVVFLAFAGDSAGDLEKYFAEHPFDYHNIPAAGTVTRDYRVQAFPTHVIIDREGRVHSRLVGGSPDRHEDLVPIIRACLAR